MHGRTPDGTVFERHGTGNGRAVLLIHGLGLNRHLWQWTLPALTDGYDVIVCDLHGHGESVAPAEPASLAGFSRQVQALMEHCEVKEAALAGFSLGGMIGRRFAQDCPAKVWGLAILHSPHRRQPEAQMAVAKRVEQARSEGPAATVEAALARWFTDAYRIAHPAIMDTVRDWVLANDPNIYPDIYRVLAEGVEEIVSPQPPLRGPALVVTGDEDFGNGPEMAYAIAAEIEDAETVILPGLRHMAMVEEPTAINRPLRNFLDRVAA